ncbi:MAG: sugar transferase, partial [Candidatus Zipacnadales bacterium]
MTSSRRAFERDHRFLLVLSDTAACVSAVITAYVIRVYTPVLVRPPLQHPLDMYLRALPVILLLWVATFESLGLYRVSRVAAPFHDLTDSVRAVSLATLVIGAVSFLSHVDYSRGMLILFWLFALIYVAIGRTLLSNRRKKALASGVAQARTIVIGCGELGRLLLQRTRAHPEFGHEVIGFVDKNCETGHIEDLPIMGRLEALPELVKKHDVAEVIVADPELESGRLMDLIASCEARPVEFHVISGPFSILTGQAQVDGLTNLPIIKLPAASFGFWQEVLKRLVDLVIGGLLLLLLLPLLLVIAALIRWQTGSPPIFRQERIGLNGK